MRIIDEWQTFIHTHFQTDGLQLPAERIRDIEQVVSPLLRSLGIVYGFHFEREPNDPGIRIVLECRPAQKELDVIRKALAETLRPIPRRPRPTVIRYANSDDTSPHTCHSRQQAGDGSTRSHEQAEAGKRSPNTFVSPDEGGPS
ncbi:MAG: hypothetical protein KatS3mg077_0208 [Candidatus Binatia bacterium]|nr:MAG: hypothetical protein KatS3mg077_0208 [Candidatus Binatia bacterium]